MKPILSICIPTYNRSGCLKECLDSIMISASGYENQIEIIVSDNASTDDTADVVRSFKIKHPMIQYYKNNENIGAERNFYLLATKATGDYIWIFGDDDKITNKAVANVIERIESGYNLIISNYSIWSKNFSILKKQTGIKLRKDQIFNNQNKLMTCFGLHLGYISLIIIKKDIFLKTSFAEFNLYSEYGFSYLYAIYAGVDSSCNAIFIADQLVCNRSGNSGSIDFCKYYVIGTSIIFNNLLSKGYQSHVIRSTKHKVLRDFLIPYMLFIKFENNTVNKKYIFNIVFKYFKKDWLFWIAGLPALYMPVFLLRLAKTFLVMIRNARKRINY